MHQLSGWILSKFKRLYQRVSWELLYLRKWNYLHPMSVRIHPFWGRWTIHLRTLCHFVSYMCWRSTCIVFDLRGWILPKWSLLCQMLFQLWCLHISWLYNMCLRLFYDLWTDLCWKLHVAMLHMWRLKPFFMPGLHSRIQVQRSD